MTTKPMRQRIMSGKCSVCGAKDGENCKPVGELLTVSIGNHKTKYRIHSDRLAIALRAFQ